MKKQESVYTQVVRDVQQVLKEIGEDMLANDKNVLPFNQSSKEVRINDITIE